MLLNEHLHLLLLAKNNSTIISKYFGLLKSQYMAVNYFVLHDNKLLVSLFALFNIIIERLADQIIIEFGYSKKRFESDITIREFVLKEAFLRLFNDNNKNTINYDKNKTSSSYADLKNTKTNTNGNLVYLGNDSHNDNSLLNLILKEFEFFVYNETTKTISKTKIEFIFKYSYNNIDNNSISSYFNIFKKYFTNFNQIDSFFTVEEAALSYNIYAVLTTPKEDFTNIFKYNNEKIFEVYENKEERIDYGFINKYTKRSQEIISINSCLSSVSFNHFSSNFSKGNISMEVHSDVLMLDIRTIPSSTFSINYTKVILNRKTNNKDEFIYLPIAVTLPVMNTNSTFNPIIFGLKVNDLISNLYHEFLIYYDNNIDHAANRNNNRITKEEFLNQYISNDLVCITKRYSDTKNSDNQISLENKEEIDIKTRIDKHINPDIESNIFLINSKNCYATCFYIGKNYFLTNKHFYFDVKANTSDEASRKYTTNNPVFISNNYFTNFIEVKFMYISQNELDLAVLVPVLDQDKIDIEEFLTRIPIDLSINVARLRDIYSLNYSYFSVNDLLALKVPFYSKGIISKVYPLKTSQYAIDLAYQITNINYSGASGCPIIDVKSNSLIGILFENISFDTDKGKIEIGSVCFCVSRDVIYSIYRIIDDSSSIEEFIINIEKNSLLNESYAKEIERILNYHKF